MMCIHELHTAAAEDLPLVTVVFNNANYAIISKEVARSYPLPKGAYDLTHVTLSFPDIAEGMDVSTDCVDSLDEIERAVSEALAADEPRSSKCRPTPGRQRPAPGCATTETPLLPTAPDVVTHVGTVRLSRPDRGEQCAPVAIPAQTYMIQGVLYLKDLQV